MISFFWRNYDKAIMMLRKLISFVIWIWKSIAKRWILVLRFNNSFLDLEETKIFNIFQKVKRLKVIEIQEELTNPSFEKPPFVQMKKRSENFCPTLYNTHVMFDSICVQLRRERRHQFNLLLPSFLPKKKKKKKNPLENFLETRAKLKLLSGTVYTRHV